jgi:hypothetical protein
MGEIHTHSISLPIFDLLMEHTRLIDEYSDREIQEMTQEAIALIRERQSDLTSEQITELVKYTRRIRSEEDSNLFFIIIAEYYDYVHQTISKRDFIPYDGKNTNKRLIFIVDNLPSRLLCMLHRLMVMKQIEEDITLNRED